MIFEADADSTIKNNTVGDQIAFARDERGNVTGLCSLENGDGLVEGILLSKVVSGKADVLLY